MNKQKIDTIIYLMAPASAVIVAILLSIHEFIRPLKCNYGVCPSLIEGFAYFLVFLGPSYAASKFFGRATLISATIVSALFGVIYAVKLSDIIYGGYQFPDKIDITSFLYLYICIFSWIIVFIRAITAFVIRLFYKDKFK